MEIRLENQKEDLNFTILNKEINGVIGTDLEFIANKIYLKNKGKEKIYINQEEIKKEDINSYKKKIKIVSKMIEPFFDRYKVYECMYMELQKNELYLKDPRKKVLDSLKIVGLDITYLNKNIPDLSSSEKKLLQLGMALMSNPEVLVLIDPFKEFDIKTERRIMSFLEVIREQYDKTIVILSDNSDMLYKYTTHLIIEKNHKIIIEGKTQELFERVDFLKRHGIPIPEIVEFTYLAKKKGAKIEYHKDIRDLIKDIYKHV